MCYILQGILSPPLFRSLGKPHPFNFFSLAVLSCSLTNPSAFLGTLSDQSTIFLACLPKIGIIEPSSLTNRKSMMTIFQMILDLFTKAYHYGLTFSSWLLKYIILKSFHKIHTGSVYTLAEDSTIQCLMEESGTYWSWGKTSPNNGWKRLPLQNVGAIAVTEETWQRQVKMVLLLFSKAFVFPRSL